jgi:FKBP-type peptidyl-prolyl cis-trans isomerase SlyD
MSKQHTIVAGKVVALSYTLSDESGEELDAATKDDPLYYLQGAENIVPGLEQALEGKSAGEKVSVKVPPELGYGPRQGGGAQSVPRDAFPPDVTLEEGMAFTVENEDGDELDLWVVGVEKDEVMVDVNHPLAGVTLCFDVEIVGVRDATAEEQQHGHPHGPGGHHHH